MATQCTPQQMEFHAFGHRAVVGFICRAGTPLRA